MSDCNCDQPERKSRDLIFTGTNTGSSDNGTYGDFSGYISINDSESSGYAVGQPVGAFNASRPGQFVLHTDWCCRRPAKALISCRGTPHGQGTARVFVEAKRDFSAYVFAEIEASVVQSAPFDVKHHFRDGSSDTVAAYPINQADIVAEFTNFWSGPVFGTPTENFAFASRNAEDGSAYLASSWPVSGWSVTTAAHHEGVRKIVRCGYREEASDVIVAAFVQPHNVTAFQGSASFGSVAVACYLEDVATPDDPVRCSLEVNSPGTVAGNPGDEAFSYPFEVPGSVFLDDNEIPQHRFVGAAATSSDGVLGNVPTGFLDIGNISTFVTCGADHANIFFDPNGVHAEGTVPAQGIRKNATHQGFVGGGATIGPVDDSESFYVKRPDIAARVPDMVAAADSWHSRHLVWKGSPLAGRNARHALRLEFVEADDPPPVEIPSVTRRHHSGGKIPAWIRWLGQRDYKYGANEPLPAAGPQFVLDWDDRHPYGGTLGLWLWNSIAGSHTLAPNVDNLPLVADTFSVHYLTPLHTENHDIVEPDSVEIEPRIPFTPWGGDSVGPFTDDDWSEIQAEQVPHFKSDYRVEWKVETFPQLWATTTLNLDTKFSGPLDIELTDSGMTTEAHDSWSAREWPTIYAMTGGAIVVRARVGWRVSVTKVQGFRRVREKGQATTIDGAGLVQAWYRDDTGDVEVFGDHECGDVACSETVVEFSIPLTHDNIMSLSSGELVTKQFLVAEIVENQAEVEDENAEPITTPVYRTIHIQVTQI